MENEQDLDLPVTQKDDFIADFHDGKDMDFSELEDKQFIVAVSTGERNSPKILASTMCGPYDFLSMVETVGKVYVDHQHHCKAYILQPVYGKRAKMLDAGTIDFIEAHYESIIFDHTFIDAISQDKPLKAGLIESDEGDSNGNC